MFSPAGFSAETDSAANADLGIALLDSIIRRPGILSLEEGARKFARRLARERGRPVLDPFLYTAYARRGWMVPNQYWTPGALAPMPIMGKYYPQSEDYQPPRRQERQDRIGSFREANRIPEGAKNRLGESGS